MIKFIEEGKRLERPAQCPHVAYSQMLKCWSKDPKERPTFTALNMHFDQEDEYASTREIMKPIRNESVPRK